MQIIRPDFIFSYWIFVWFILYITHIVSINPKLWLIVALFENIRTLCIVIVKGQMYTIIRFMIVNFWIKVIPLYFIRKTKISKKDVFYSILIFFVYLLWLYIQDQNIIDIYSMIYKSQLKKSNNISIGSYLYDKIYNIINA